MRELLSVYLKGFLMGTADSVPGVSGGTIALITGIYDRLVGAIAAFDPRSFRGLLSPHDPEARAEVLAALEAMDARFLAALAAGIATAVVTVLRIVEALSEAYPAETAALFFGLIGASAVVLYDEADVTTPRRLAVAVVGFLLAVAVTVATGTAGSTAPPSIALAGAVAVTAMILPGVSGAFLLEVLGQYDYMRGVLIAFTDALAALASGGSAARVVETLLPIAVFGAGGVVGLLTVAHAISRALDRYRQATLTFLVSLMVGGLAAPTRDVIGHLDALTPATVGPVVFAALVGAAAVLVLERYSDGIEYT